MKPPKKVAQYLPFIPDHSSFPFDKFWEFFLKQQLHLHSGNFRFNRAYIADTLRAGREFSRTVEFKVTLETIWSLAVSAGIWGILADLDVDLDYGRVSLEALNH